MLLNQIFDILLHTNSPVTRYLAILALSVVSAGLFVIVARKFGNQHTLDACTKRLWGNILQIRLYPDSLPVLVSSVFNILRFQLLYLWHMLLPIGILLLPFTLVMVQISYRFEYAPLTENEQFLIQAIVSRGKSNTFSDDWEERIYCEPSANIVLETPPLRIPLQGQVFWRARRVITDSATPAVVRIGLRGDSSFVEKTVATSYTQRRFMPEKMRRSWWNWLAKNAEGMFVSDSFLHSVSISYQRATYPLLVWRVHAIPLYVIVTLLCGGLLHVLVPRQHIIF